MAARAFTILIFMLPHGLLAKDKPERAGADKQQNTELRQSELPDPSFSESSTTGCDRHCIDFNINNPNPNYTYLWTFGDASISFNGDQLDWRESPAKNCKTSVGHPTSSCNIWSRIQICVCALHVLEPL